MRIISGCRRGHKLFAFEGENVRPTADRVKEAIFNIIRSHIPSANVLDMFAGSGALSFEAISRGAAKATLLDNDKRSAELIRKNIASLGFEESCTLREISCFDYLKNCRESFDIIFHDPPDKKGFIEPALEAISVGNILAKDGIAVLESDNTDFRSEISGLEILNQKRYGRTFVTVYGKI